MGQSGGGRVSVDVEDILRKAARNGTHAVVIDLRRNSGGSLAEAIDLTGLFIDKGPVVQVRNRNGKIEVYKDRRSGQVWDGPLIVLTSPWSASASEIFAGAIQDYDRGLIVGAQATHGKGSVQTVIGLGRYVVDFFPGFEPGAAGMLKLTTQQFYRVNGASTQARGIQADIVLPSPVDGSHTFEGDLPNALPWDEVPSATVRQHDAVKKLVPELQARSATRVLDNENLQRFVEFAARRAEIEETGGVVTLLLADRLAEIDAEDGREEEEDEEDEDETKDGEDPPDYVLDEALLVARDLLELAG
jgi:carboxyl-terminal processing protease